jgi:flagellin
MDTAMERMSSGSKINKASDDAAGLAVSTKLETTVSSSKIASNNVAIGENLLDTAEGTLNTISDNFSRIRDLTEEGSTGTYSSDDVTAIVTEISQRMQQVDKSSNAAAFNDVSLFNSKTTGSTGITLQTGTTSSDTLTLDSSIFKNATSSALGLFTVDSLGNLQVQVVTTTGGVTTTQTVVLTDSAGKTYNVGTGSTAVSSATYYSTIENAMTSIFNNKASYATTTGETTSTATSGLTSYSSSNFLNDVDTAISGVSDRLTKIGAYDNRLSSVSDSLTTEQTNLTAANSTIKDADVATESANYVQNQILQSASTTLLTQANSAAEIALTLIKG